MSENLPVPTPPKGQFLLFTESGANLRVRVDGHTVWLTQRQLAELYEIRVPTVNEHLSEIYGSRELSAEGTIRKYLIVQTEGTRQVQREIDHYSLDVVLAIGYRVRSSRGTLFRKWATAQLKELLVKGFVMDDQRLKEGRSLGADYFDELLQRIRDIRASEKRFYQKVRDIFALSTDYDPADAITTEFFQVIQNKLHWAITGHTAAELIAIRADASRPNMGLTSWRGGKVRQGDVTIAKNYLNEEEVRRLNRLVTMWLDYAEEQAEAHQPVYMADWRERLDEFLKFNRREVLAHAGKVTMEEAKRKALGQYERFHKRRLAEEDAAAAREFEQEVKRLKGQEESGDIGA